MPHDFEKPPKNLIITPDAPLINHQISKLIANSIATEKEDDRGNVLGFMARALVQASMPHKEPKELYFKRKNGNYTLVMTGHPDIGLPFGSIPRLEMIWITSEALKKKTREIVLGPTLSSFMAELGIPRTGAYIDRLKNQTKRLFSCSISCTYDDGKTWQIENVRTVKRASLLWEPNEKMDHSKNESILLLDQDFFDEIITRPVPIDLNVIKTLKNSSLALDIYSWLTYRMSYLNRNTCIPWDSLHNQFGSNYANDKSGRYAFKKKFSEQMLKVLAVYPDAKVEKTDTGLILSPSPPHVSKKSATAPIPSTIQLPHPNRVEIAKQNKIKQQNTVLKLNRCVEILNNLDAVKKKAVLKDFEDYLRRRNLPDLCINLAQKIMDQMAERPVLQHLYAFLESQYHHLFAAAESLEKVPLEHA